MAIISISDSQINSADQVLVADASSKIPAKDGSQITILNATNVASGTIATARLDTGTTANKIVVLDGSGNLPVVDGSLLTGVVSATVSASDPTVSTNPSAGLGAEWNNSTSGEMYICTDATAGANVWTNVGAGSGDVVPWVFQGSAYGYAHGGHGVTPDVRLDNIERFSFTSNGNAADVGNLTEAKDFTSGQSSTTHGYCSGGRLAEPPGGETNRIEKYAFAASANATDVADLTVSRKHLHGTGNATHGYAHAGYPPSSGINVIDKFPYASATNASDHGDLATAVYQPSEHSSTTYGYSTGGSDNSYAGVKNVIEKYAFASNTTASDVGDLTSARYELSGTSSTTHGYVQGGMLGGAPKQNFIDRFSFSSDGNATDWADLTVARSAAAGCSSTTHGYAVGGYSSSGSTDVIDNYPFASQTNASDVGNLVVSGIKNAGTQY